MFGATVEYSTHAGLDNQSYIKIIDAAYSVLDLLQVYHHVDGRVLDSAVAPILISI